MKLSQSQKMFEQAAQSIPAATSNPARGFHQVGGSSPIFMRNGKGAYLYDIDENQYIDYVLSWGPLILGHAHKKVTAALRAQIDFGTTFGTPTEAETILAQTIRTALPSIERLRFVNSGTEATMAAVELARAYTGRQRIVKFQGCYHGWYAPLLAGSAYRPEVSDGLLIANYNDLDSTKKLFERHSEEIAAVIVEPIAANMGVVLPIPGFLEGLRQLCDHARALLIFDEVMTGFRVAYGGAQTIYRVTPDITCLGKIIGGGLPIGLYGGRAEIMMSVAPYGNMYQGGTYSGNPLSAVAGIATLSVLQGTCPYSQLNDKARSLCDRITALGKELGVPLWTNQVGGMFCVFFNQEPVSHFQAVQRSNTAAFAHYFWHMLEQGVYLPPSQFEACHLSTSHTWEDIERTVAAARAALLAVAALDRRDAPN